jgi:ABC-type phosphate transport system substrate-binding protein
MNKFVSCFLTMMTLYVVSSNAGDAIVIVNKDNAVTVLTRAEVENMFLGKTTQWPGGGKILPCDQKAESKVAAIFCSSFLNKNVADYQAYWMEIMLSGSATPPKSAVSDQEVIEFVAKTKGAIGYIDAATTLGDGVKKVNVK